MSGDFPEVEPGFPIPPPGQRVETMLRIMADGVHELGEWDMHACLTDLRWEPTGWLAANPQLMLLDDPVADLLALGHLPEPNDGALLIFEGWAYKSAEDWQAKANRREMRMFVAMLRRTPYHEPAVLGLSWFRDEPEPKLMTKEELQGGRIPAALAKYVATS